MSAIYYNFLHLLSFSLFILFLISTRAKKWKIILFLSFFHFDAMKKPSDCFAYSFQIKLIEIVFFSLTYLSLLLFFRFGINQGRVVRKNIYLLAPKRKYPLVSERENVCSSSLRLWGVIEMLYWINSMSDDEMSYNAHICKMNNLSTWRNKCEEKCNNNLRRGLSRI
jgi:hypothetical protein